MSIEFQAGKALKRSSPPRPLITKVGKLCLKEGRLLALCHVFMSLDRTGIRTRVHDCLLMLSGALKSGTSKGFGALRSHECYWWKFLPPSCSQALAVILSKFLTSAAPPLYGCYSIQWPKK